MKRWISVLLALLLLFPAGAVLADNVEMTEEPGVVRLEGDDRYATAAQISLEAFGEAPIALIASGEEFADALGASALTNTYEAPILLTKKNELPEVTAQTLHQLGVDTVYIVGGAGTVSDEVKEELEAIATTVNRIEGPDRYATAAQVATTVAGTNPMAEVYLAYGQDFPDALSAGAPAAVHGRPILYTQKTLPEVTKQSLATLKAEDVTVVGGDGLIPKAVVDALEEMELETDRLQGTDRYATSVAVAKEEFSNRVETVILASGQTFPDALVGTGLAGVKKAPILLTGKTMSEDVKAYLEQLPALKNIIVLGGEKTVAKAIMDEAKQILNRKKPNTAPVIGGPSELETTLHDEKPDWWTVFPVTDDRDAKEELALEVETGALNMHKVGSFEVLLMATDKDGAKTQKLITVHVREQRGVDLNNPNEVARARVDMLHMINDAREDVGVREAIPSAMFEYNELDDAAQIWVDAWAAKGTIEIVPKPSEIDFTPVNVISHRGFRTTQGAFEAMWAETTNQTKFLERNGVKNVPFTQVVVGSAIAKDVDGTYYWVVLMGNRGIVTKKYAEKTGISAEGMKPVITLIQDEITLERNRDQFDLRNNNVVRVKDAMDNDGALKRLVIVRIEKEDGSFVLPSKWGVHDLGTYKVTYALEGFFGVMADQKTLTIHVVLP